MDKLGSPGGLPPGTAPPPPGMAEAIRQAAVLSPATKTAITKENNDAPPSSDRATISEEEEGQQSKSPLGAQKQSTLAQTARNFMGDRTGLGDLQRQAERKGDSIASRAFQELAQRDPESQGATRDNPPGGDKTNLGYRTENGYFLELQNRDETQAKTQGYKLARFMEGDPTTLAELYERQFDETGRCVFSLDQKTSPRPNGQLQNTERRVFDGEEYSGSACEQETVFNFDLQNAPDPLKSFSGFQKFLSLLAQTDEGVTYTQTKQKQLAKDQATPQSLKQPQQQLTGKPGASPFQSFARPTLGQPPAGPKQQPQPQSGNNSATAGILLNLATQHADGMLPEPGQLYQLTSQSGLAMELFIPASGKKTLAVRNRQGNLIYWEEEDEGQSEIGEDVRRRTAYDRTRKLKRHLEARRRGESVAYQEESQYFYQSLVDLGLVGREVAAVWRIIKQFPGGIQEIIEEERHAKGGKRTLQRVQDGQVVFVEERLTDISADKVVQSVQRKDVRRGRTGVEEVTTTPASVSKEGIWHNDNVVYIQFALHMYRKGLERHKVMRYAQPARNANGEVVTHYDDAIGTAARLVRRQTNSPRSAADLVGPHGRHLMAGRKEDPDCLEIEPTFQVSLRWETLQYPALTFPDDIETTVQMQELSFDSPDSPNWLLQEDFSVYETRGKVRGPDPEAPLLFSDRVVMRRYPGFGGTLQKYIEVQSAKRSGSTRDSLLSLIYLEGGLLAEAQARSGHINALEAIEGMRDDMGVSLLARAARDSDLLLENTQTSHPPSGTKMVLQSMTVLDRERMAVGRVARPKGPVPWWIRNVVPPLSSFQAFLTQTNNTAWSLNTNVGARGEVQIGVELPDCKVPVRATMWETTLESATVADMDTVLKAHSMPTWEDLIEQNASVDRFEWRVRNRNDLIMLCRSVQGSREGENWGGERIVVKTPEGDLLVLINGDLLNSSFGYMRGREGDEHFTVPHPASNDTLILNSDEEGLFGEVVDERGVPVSLGRLGEAFGGLLGWVESGRPLQRPGGQGVQIPPGFAERLQDLCGAVRGVGRFPGPDHEAVKAVLWDFSHLGWGETDDQAALTEPYVLQLLAAGHSPLEAACLVLLGEFRRIKPDPEKLADLRIVVE